MKDLRLRLGLRLGFTLMLVLLLSAGVFATTGLQTPVYDYSEGNWTNPTKGADYNYSDYAQCNEGDCYLIANFTFTGLNTGYMDSIIWGTNNSQVVFGVEVTDQPDCLMNLQPVSVMVSGNRTAGDNFTFSCEDRTSPLSWLFLGSMNSTEYNISGMYAYWTDIAPTVTVSLPVEGYVKPCNDEQELDQLPIVFTVSDSTDTELTCCADINGVTQNASCNSSIQADEESILYATLTEGITNTVVVRCEDENGYGLSSSVNVVGSQCTQCSTEFMDALLTFALIMALLFSFGAMLIGGKHMAYFLGIGLFIVAMVLIIWYVNNWNTLC